ncbi:MAG: aminopeptidase P family protein [Candidatus Aminicenantes bacterium]|nr:MAG: aminopeptidase P family protein [Candidatus Aminicenantes bacterium]
MFSANTYKERRQRLRTQVSSGLILLLGNDESPMNYRDNPYPFRQDSSFLYFFGLSYPGLVGVIDVEEGRDIILGRELTVEDIVWMGKQPSLEEKCARAGVKETLPLTDIKDLLAAARLRKRPIHFLPPYRCEHILKLSDWLEMPPEQVEKSASVELIMAVVDQRNKKTPEEIEEIEKAVDISADMHLTAMRMVRPGITEAEIAAAVQQVALAAGGQLSFPIIATVNGQILHNHSHDNILQSGQMFLLDAGAETAMGYAGDLSSTIPVDKHFTSRQKEIYQICLEAHEAAIAALQPGVPFKNIHLLACRVIAQGLKDMGFMRGDMEEAVAAGAHALFFPCGTGHMMGLDVHDMENLGEKYVGYGGKEKSTQFGLKSLRLARELEPGFVITIEPGIYFIPELIDMWKAEAKFTQFINYDKVETYKDFGGLRNEEDFLITEDGYRLLGKPIPKTIEDVEAMKA